MPNTTTFSFGDVVLVPFPFTDQSHGKKRPAVVISSASYNKSRPDIIVMAITSQLSNRQRMAEIIIHKWKSAGLIKASAIKPIIMTIEKNSIIGRLGALHADDLAALKTTLTTILG